MSDNAGGGDIGSRIDYRADHPAGRDARGNSATGIDAFQPTAGMFGHAFQEIPPRNSVLGSEHHGIARVGRSEIVYHVAELMRLHCKNDEVLLAHLAKL